MTDRERIIRAFGKLNMKVSGGTTVGKSSEMPPEKTCAVLLCGSDICLTEAYGALRAMRDDGWKTVVILTRSAESLLSVEAIQESVQSKKVLLESEGVHIQDLIDQMDLLVVPNMTQNTLAKTAVGIQDELASLLIWQALVTKKDVLLNTNSVFDGWFSIDSNRAMKRIMQGHVSALKGFGARILDHYDYLRELNGGKARGRMQSADQPRREKSGVSVGKRELTVSEISSKRLLTESDIKALTGAEEITITKGQILTPLGRDAAISRGIRIVYQRQ